MAAWEEDSGYGMEGAGKWIRVRGGVCLNPESRYSWQWWKPSGNGTIKQLQASGLIPDTILDASRAAVAFMVIGTLRRAVL
jgi:hypothetical protein